MTDRQTSGENKGKTALRMQYEAEAQVIRNKLGSIEDIRKNLGLSRRKICQLLLIDPSTWTRWTKDPEKIPPHIFRTLQWYLSLIEKHPEWHPQNSFGPGLWRSQNEQIHKLTQKLEGQMEALRQENQALKTRLNDTQSLSQSTTAAPDDQNESLQVGLAWKMLLLANTVLMVFMLIRTFLG